MIDGGLPVLSVMGSMHEVGYWEGAITADTPCNPQSQYGIAKNALRQSLLLYSKDKKTSVRWLRAYYIFGDDTRGSSIFAKIAQAANEGKTTFPFTTGKNLYDFIEVDELARRIAAATLSPNYEGTINVCTGEPKSLAEQVEWYIKDRGYSIQLQYGVFPDRPYDSPGVWGDASIINAILQEESGK
jgi:dTDP-6-deoxy-L-talose 4-dehydrogenase (NAD+)